jgi:hypothetical protein
MFTKILIIVVALIIVGAPLVCSAMYCVPKWWAVKVVPKAPFMAKIPDFFAYNLDPMLDKTLNLPIFGIIIRGVLAIPLTFIGLVVWYCTKCSHWVLRKCPYTPPQDTKYLSDFTLLDVTREIKDFVTEEWY